MYDIIKDSLRASEMIADYLSDPSGVMADELKAWIGESPQNREIFEKALKGSNIARTLGYIDKVDTAGGWKTLGVTRRNRRTGRILLAAVSTAAAILIALVLRPGGEDPHTELPGGYVSIVDGSGREYILSDLDQRVDIGGGGSLVREGNRIVVVDDRQEEDRHEPELITVRIPRGSEYQLALPDGTTVWLGAETSLTFPDRFGDGARDVEITGEGNFTVTPDALRPFTVRCSEISITVLGTIFHVYGFEQDGTITTTLIEGSIRHGLNGEDRGITLRPSQQTVYSRQNGNISVREVDTGDIQAYRDGKIVFRNTPLREIMANLERTFDCRITIENPAIADDCYHLIVNKNKGVDLVLDQLQKSGGFSYEKTNGKIRIY